MIFVVASNIFGLLGGTEYRSPTLLGLPLILHKVSPEIKNTLLSNALGGPYFSSHLKKILIC